MTKSIPVLLVIKFVIVFVPLLICAIVLVYTEWKSVWEKTSEKFRKAIAENPAEILEFIKDNKKQLTELVGDATKEGQ